MDLGGFGGGVAGGATVAIIIKATDEFSNTFDKAQKSLSGFEKAGVGATAALGGVAAGGIAAIGIVADLAIESGKSVGIQNSFNRMFGDEAPAALDELKAATKGTVSDIDIMTAANQALLLGIDKDALPEMFKGAMASAQATGRPVKDAISDITLGIGRQSRMILDNLGIIVDADNANQTYAESLGKTTEELTDAERKTAFMNATMQALKDNVQKVGEVQDNASLAAQRSAAALDNFKDKVGQAFGPGVTAAIEALTPIMEQLGTVFTEQVMPAMLFATDAIVEFLGSFKDQEGTSMFIKALGYILEGTFVFIGLVIKGIQTVFEWMNVCYQWGIVLKDKVVSALKLTKDEMEILFNAGETGWEMLKLGAATAANFIVDAFQNSFNMVIGWINNLIDAANAASNALGGGDILDRIGELDFSGAKIDTSQITANLQNLSTERQGIVNDIKINIEQLSGVDPDEMAKALKTKLVDLVSA